MWLKRKQGINRMSVVDILGENGVFAKKLENFKIRDVQLQLADKIAKTIQDNGTLIAEAGTGTGKTFAYLVPAILKNKKPLFLPEQRIFKSNYFTVIYPRFWKSWNSNRRFAYLKDAQIICAITACTVHCIHALLTILT